MVVCTSGKHLPNMEHFLKYFRNTQPANVTYLAIGAAHITKSETQQHPPFLDRLMILRPDLSFQIIIIDPNTENPPEVAICYGAKELKLFGSEVYGSNHLVYRNEILTINVIKEAFDFNFKETSTKVNNETFDKKTRNNVLYDIFDFVNFKETSNKSKELLFALIDKVVDVKERNEKSTYLLFVHDFSGNRIDDLAYYIDELQRERVYTGKWNDMNYVKYDLYRRCVQIDLTHRKNEGCNPDIRSSYFCPFLVAENNTLEIFNPFNAKDHELISALNCDELVVRETIVHSIKYQLDKFRSVALPKYLEKIQDILSQPMQINQNNIYELIQDCINSFNMELSRVTSFLNFFEVNNKVLESLNDFKELCEIIHQIHINRNELITKFQIFEREIRNFLEKVKSVRHTSILYDKINIIKDIFPNIEFRINDEHHNNRGYRNNTNTEYHNNTNTEYHNNTNIGYHNNRGYRNNTNTEYHNNTNIGYHNNRGYRNNTNTEYHNNTNTEYHNNTNTEYHNNTNTEYHNNTNIGYHNNRGYRNNTNTEYHNNTNIGYHNNTNIGHRRNNCF
ncbi:MAG: hypothetical protein QXW79_00320 [Thermoplasmata archaeon]